MTLTIAQLKAAFQGGAYGNAAARTWYRNRGYKTRNWYGLCQGVTSWVSWFTNSKEPVWFVTARAAYQASKIVSKKPYDAPIGAVHFWHVVFNGSPDGHTAISLGGGQMLHGYDFYDDKWGTNLGTVDFNRFQNAKRWQYLGWAYTAGGNVMDVSDIFPKQRMVTSIANIRHLPSTKSGKIVGTLPKGAAATMIGYVNGERVEDKHNLWFVHELGYVHCSSTRTPHNADNLPNLTDDIPWPVIVPPVVPPVEPPKDPDPTPEPEPEPVEPDPVDPEPEPEPEPTEPEPTDSVETPQPARAWWESLIGWIIAVLTGRRA